MTVTRKRARDAATQQQQLQQACCTVQHAPAKAAATATASEQHSSVRLHVQERQIVISGHATLAAGELPQVVQCVQNLIDASARGRNAEHRSLQWKLDGATASGVRLEFAFTVANEARTGLGALASDDVDPDEDTSTIVRLPGDSQKSVWLLLDVLAMQLAGFGSLYDFGVLNSCDISAEEAFCRVQELFCRLQIADFLALGVAYSCAVALVCKVIAVVVCTESDNPSCASNVHRRAMKRNTFQELAWLPPHLRRLIAQHMSWKQVLNPLVPSSLLSHRLAALCDRGATCLSLPDLDLAELHRLCRDMIPLPSVTELTIGYIGRISTGELNTDGGALGDILAHLPGLQRLCLSVDVDEYFYFVEELPLPATLRFLDLSGCTLHAYMGKERSCDDIRVACYLLAKQVTEHLALEELVLPFDSHSAQLEHDFNFDLLGVGGLRASFKGRVGHGA